MPASKTELTSGIWDKSASKFSHPEISLQVRQETLLGFGLGVCFLWVYFLVQRNLNTLPCWRNRARDHMSNYEQPYIYSPTVFSHCFHYNRKLCQSCSLWGSGFRSSRQGDQTFWFLWFPSALLSSFPEHWAVKDLPFYLPFQRQQRQYNSLEQSNSPFQQLPFNSSSAHLTFPWAALTHQPAEKHS